MFIAQLGEAVIGADEEVIAAEKVMLPMLDQQSWIMGVGWNLGMVSWC